MMLDQNGRRRTFRPCTEGAWGEPAGSSAKPGPEDPEADSGEDQTAEWRDHVALWAEVRRQLQLGTPFKKWAS